MDYKILVLDIDGTLTNSKKEITEKTLNALLKLQESGKIVVLASGRPTPGISALAKQLQLSKYNGYILSFNGAKIINCTTQEVIYDKTIPSSHMKTLYDAAIKHKVGIMSYEGDTVIAGTPIDKYMEIECKINNIPIKEVSNFPEYMTFDVNKFIFTEESNYLAKVELKMQEEFKGLYSIYRSEPYFLEIMPNNIDKAYSLSRLLEHLNLTKEEMICCGDSYNDITMIDYAGLGVAMENAKVEAKAVANYITASNDNDGIVEVINKFML